MNMDEIQEFDKQKTKILKYILFKKRTEHEVRQKFSKEIEENRLEDLITDLKENMYISDETYIKRAVQEFMAIKTLSIREIKYKLISKGIANNQVENYITKHKEELQEYEKKSVYKIIRKKESNMDRQELINFLRKKGYQDDNIKQAIME